MNSKAKADFLNVYHAHRALKIAEGTALIFPRILDFKTLNIPTNLSCT